MRLRAMMAGLLAVLLLSLPCVGSGCQLGCALKAGCHEGAAAQTGVAMADCRMTKSDRGMAQLAAAWKVPACRHAQPVEQPATVDGERVGDTRAATGVHGVVSVLLISGGMDAAGVVSGERTAADTPPGRSALLISLQSCLRV